MKIPHLEDYIITAEDSIECVELLSALIHNVYHNQKSLGNISVKYDGIMLVLGIDDEGFYLSNKSFFNKTPIKFRSYEEIQNYDRWSSEKRQKLCHYWQVVQDKDVWFETNSEGYATFEVLSCPFTLNEETGRSKPNILEYDIPQAKNSLYMIPHKQREGYEYERWLLTNDNSSNVWASFRDIIQFQEQEKLGQKEYKAFSEYINKNIREGRDQTDLSWIKTSTEFEYLYEDAIRLKYSLLFTLREIIKTQRVQPYYNGEVCDHEGYIFSYKNTTVKLVDRSVFSRNNFNSQNRGWTK